MTKNQANFCDLEGITYRNNGCFLDPIKNINITPYFTIGRLPFLKSPMFLPTCSSSLVHFNGQAPVTLSNYFLSHMHEEQHISKVIHKHLLRTIVERKFNSFFARPRSPQKERTILNIYVYKLQLKFLEKKGVLLYHSHDMAMCEMDI